VVNGGVLVGEGGPEVMKGAGAGWGEIGRIRMDPQDHIGSPIDLPDIRMGGDKTEQTVETGDSGEGRGRLFRGEGTGCQKDAGVHAATVV
jgi:hypothetical protein